MTKLATKRKPGRPKLDQEEGKSSIRSAALKEFARCGFKGASIEGIARAAGVAKPLVYYHFSSKDELWRASLAQALEGLRFEAEQFGEDLKSESPEIAVDLFARSSVEFAARNPWLVRISVDELRQGGTRADWLKENYLVPQQKMLVPIIESMYSPQKRVPENLAAHLIPTIFGAINFPFIDQDVIAAAHEVDVFSEEYIGQQVELISALLRACLDRYA
ncbi:MAG: TetR/AcrR family transcriptional regulator [Pseudomonadota bacterium]